MIRLSTYLTEGMKLTEEQKKKLIALDKEYGELVFMYRKDWNTKDLENMDEEREKFFNARKRGLKYYPQLKNVGGCKFDTDGIYDRLAALRSEFVNFKCFLSKYYIELIQDMMHSVEFALNKKEKYPMYVAYHKQTPTLEQLRAAEELLSKHPYRKVEKTDRTINGKEAAELIQAHIDKLGYGWKVQLNDKMIPRMNVNIDQTMNVNPNAMFSKTDIEGLKAHEVEGHIGRRYYGLKTGLYLFLMGLHWRNTLDEGLAIWNSLHKVEKVKPNVEFNIALKTIIAYYLDKKDFCELFDMCKELAPNMPDSSLFATLTRYKREVADCKILGGNGDDMSYFCGYLMVKNMTDAERDDILKYNIGPDQIADLPNIKAFLKINKFESLI